MSSFFEFADKEANPSLNFWRRVDNLSFQNHTEQKLHESILLYLMPDGSFKQRHTILTTTRLYRSCSDLQIISKMACVHWKKLEPFSDESNTVNKFGFRLSQGEIYQDFFTTSSDELEAWLRYLCNLAILGDFEEDYVIIREIGRGNYGKVYLVEDAKDHQQFAVKTIEKARMNTYGRSSALLNEIRLLRKVQHRFVITLYRVYESKELVYLVQDYITGGDLFERVSQKRTLTEEAASKFMSNLLEAIDYIHSLNIIHRDLKLENILMTSSNDFEFKIADFGLACEHNSDQMLMCGSPGYVAPEILKKNGYGKKVDIFSAGIILYILLSSRTPFSGKNPKEVLLKNKECRLYFQDKYWKSISKEGIDFVLRLTDCNIDMRPSAKEALNHPWFSISHRCKRSVKFSSPAAEDDLGISAELLKRMNNQRQIVNLEVPKEEELKISSNLQTVGKNTTKNILTRLRDADSTLH